MDQPHVTRVVDRRAFIAGLTAVAATAALDAQQTTPVPIIDTHIHLFDPNRPQGAPYTGPQGKPPITATPALYRRLATPLGAVGAIEVEASPWIEDNLWVLEVAEPNPIIVGTVGNLEPDKPEFPEYLERYHKNPLFRGIRYGNLWGRDLSKQSGNTAFINGLKLLAQADLVMDTANPRVDLLEAIVRITDQVPDLRVVIDHLPNLEPTPAERPAYERVLAEIGKRPHIYVKLSSVIHRVSGRISTDVSAYRDRLDSLIGIFGEDRIIFGSDWPNSDGVAPVDKVFAVVKDYFRTKPRGLQEKYFWRNSIAAYRWIKRTPGQPSL